MKQSESGYLASASVAFTGRLPVPPASFWMVAALAAPLEYDVVQAFSDDLGFSSGEFLALLVPFWLSIMVLHLVAERRLAVTFWALLISTGLLATLLVQMLSIRDSAIVVTIALLGVTAPRWTFLKAPAEWRQWAMLLLVFVCGALLGDIATKALGSWSILPLFGTLAFATFVGYRTHALPSSIAFWVACLFVRPIGFSADEQTILALDWLGHAESRVIVGLTFVAVCVGLIVWSTRRHDTEIHSGTER